MSDKILFICFLALIIFNIFLYHKIFDVLYFDLGKGLLKELIGSIFAALFEMALIFSVGKWVLGIISKILGVSLKIIIVIVGISITSYIIYYLYKLIKPKQEKDNKENVENNFNNHSKTDKKTVKDETTYKTQYYDKVTIEKNAKIICPNCNKQIMKTAKFCNFCGKINQDGGRNSNEM